jgi:hypothetical protein
VWRYQFYSKDKLQYFTVENVIKSLSYMQMICLVTDANECTLGTASCPANSQCVNKEPGYDCQCVSGYTKVGALCQGRLI